MKTETHTDADKGFEQLTPEQLEAIYKAVDESRYQVEYPFDLTTAGRIGAAVQDLFATGVMNVKICFWWLVNKARGVE